MRMQSLVGVRLYFYKAPLKWAPTELGLGMAADTPSRQPRGTWRVYWWVEYTTTTTLNAEMCVSEILSNDTYRRKQREAKRNKLYQSKNQTIASIGGMDKQGVTIRGRQIIQACVGGLQDRAAGDLEWALLPCHRRYQCCAGGSMLCKLCPDSVQHDSQLCGAPVRMQQVRSFPLASPP